jgi:hypothetical protein
MAKHNAEIADGMSVDHLVSTRSGGRRPASAARTRDDSSIHHKIRLATHSENIIPYMVFYKKEQNLWHLPEAIERC